MRTAGEAPDAGGPEAVLFGKTRRRLLGWLFTHPDQPFYVRELVRFTGVAQGAISGDLEKLAAAGILRRDTRGNQVFYQADAKSPIFGGLKSIFGKTAGLADELRRALEPLGSQIRVALLHGSAATGALRASSDLDLVVIGASSLEDVASALAPAQARLGREINPIVYTVGEFRSKKRSQHHFVTTVLREPHLLIVGDPGELEQLGSERPAPSPPHDTLEDQKPVRRRRPRPRRGASGHRKPEAERGPAPDGAFLWAFEK
jgi:predicted nucleotidyltransferase